MERNRNSISGPEALLKWVNDTIAEATEVRVKNFTNDWKTGRALCALVFVLEPKAVGECLFDTRENQLAALRTALDVLERHGIPRLIEAEDFEVADRQSNMTYVSEVRKRWPAPDGETDSDTEEVTPRFDGAASDDADSDGSEHTDTAPVRDNVSPVKSSPIKSSPIKSSPIKSSPIKSSPIKSSPVRAAQQEQSVARVARRESRDAMTVLDVKGDARSPADARVKPAAELQEENRRLLERIEKLERHVAAAAPRSPRSPRTTRDPHAATSPASPLVRTAADDYPFKSAVVVVVTGVVLTALAALDFLPFVAIIPFSFEVVRFFTVVAFSLHQSLGALLLGVGAAAAWQAERQRRADGGRSLLRFGVYGVSRHPFFLGCGAAMAGLALALNSMPFLLLVATWLAYIHFQIVPGEEERLSEFFDADWDDYAANVPKWLLV